MPRAENPLVSTVAYGSSALMVAGAPPRPLPSWAVKGMTFLPLRSYWSSKEKTGIGKVYHPDGRSQKDDVIVIQVGQRIGKFRTSVIGLFGIGEIGQLPINSGIVVLFHGNSVNVAIGLFFDYFGYVLNGTILLAILLILVEGFLAA